MHIKARHLDQDENITPHEYASAVNIFLSFSPFFFFSVVLFPSFFADGRVSRGDCSGLGGETYIRTHVETMVSRGETIVPRGGRRLTRFNPLRRSARITFQMNPRPSLFADHFCFQYPVACTREGQGFPLFPAIHETTTPAPYFFPPAWPSYAPPRLFVIRFGHWGCLISCAALFGF